MYNNCTTTVQQLYNNCTTTVQQRPHVPKQQTGPLQVRHQRRHDRFVRVAAAVVADFHPTALEQVTHMQRRVRHQSTGVVVPGQCSAKDLDVHWKTVRGTFSGGQE
jgi:hypothetical protein